MSFHNSVKFGHSLLLAGIIFSGSIVPKIADATIVVVDTNLGSFQVNLFDAVTPATVENFLFYVNNGRYTDSFIHRVVVGFVVQGGGFTFNNNWPPIDILAQAPVANEPALSNRRGTIAMAKLGGDPNSATSQWFVNLTDNSANLDSQNGGFAVFGQIDAAGMAVIDAIAGVPSQNAGGAFTSLPLQNFTGNSTVDIVSANLVMINSVTVLDLSPDTAAGLSPALNTSQRFSVGGSVSGLTGTVVLQLNGSEMLPIAFDQEFTFTGLLSVNASYSVTVSSQPDNQTCTVTNGGGLISFSNISNVAVTCVVITTDSDGDGFDDDVDIFPNDPTEWADNDSDGIGDNADTDDDNDGAPDSVDAFPLDPNESADTDSDGIGDNADPDDDNDGVLDAADDFPLGRFTDARPDFWAFTFVEALARAGVTVGCGGSSYCPADSVTREQMAVFLERGMRGSAFIPPVATGTAFLDVGANDFAAAFIEQLLLDGITSGCGNKNYCPNDTVTRSQMAVFLLRAMHGAAFTPPAATGIFADVPLGSFAVDWIEQLSAEGITGGCGGGNYCPDDPVKRDQMAVFLVRAFGL